VLTRARTPHLLVADIDWDAYVDVTGPTPLLARLARLSTSDKTTTTPEPRREPADVDSLVRAGIAGILGHTASESVPLTRRVSGSWF
jgi:hypothetical protein